MGKRVAFARQLERPGSYTKDGAYAEYCVTTAINCITLEDNVTFEQGASAVINPFTTVALFERVKELKA